MATISERLIEAENEYHALITGQKARVVVDQNGERVEFVMASAPRLAQYIQQLKNQLNPQRRGPAKVWF